MSCDDQGERKALHAGPRSWITCWVQKLAKGRDTLTMRHHHAVHGVITRCMRRSRTRQSKYKQSKCRRGWAGWRPLNEEATTEFKQKVTRRGNVRTGVSLEEIQKRMALRRPSGSPQEQGGETQKIPEDVSRRDMSGSRVQQAD